MNRLILTISSGTTGGHRFTRSADKPAVGRLYDVKTAIGGDGIVCVCVWGVYHGTFNVSCRYG